ncbi:MAG: DNA-directed RNA polymerase subunit beta', partial [Candidatus Kerfeldbacteria bacterium]|nr:DNA-directed RNA polymerase subunit beta' [Candidatus Kerfeldbacteria bacterium]
VEAFRKSSNNPNWMILKVLPVLPPDLRPMVQLDGGRFATSDLNDLYRRVINRNNRLRRLLELGAPDIIIRNEKRMLQEAVDSLIDNGRRGRAVAGNGNHKLKSLSDMLKGKQGRFRQNLLGKRVDYSGRSVIVVGPELKLHQCGLPKRMALELFKPFVISRLIKQEFVHNVRSASRFIESGRPEVWDILEDVTRNAHVLLNRAPTLHRLGIQAFQPILIEGKAIQVHPLVCPAFNADFDGDQMAVHVPLTEEAKVEARDLMLSSKNLLKPATGDPIVTPSQDIVLGSFYMTQMRAVEKPRSFSSPEEAVLAFDHDIVGMREQVRVRIEKATIDTTVGRILFNRMMPEVFGFQNETMDKKRLRGIISNALSRLGTEQTAALLDDLKELTLSYLTQSGVSWGMDDLPELPVKQQLLDEAQTKVDEVQAHFEAGFLTDDERHSKIIEIWAGVKDRVTKFSQEQIDAFGTVNMMVESGARGSWGQITQMMGMKGLVTNPAGETIELPVKKSFKEGFDVLEYFISTHGARKGLSDTALRTANAGYLTRRLVDVAQDVVISIEDCGDPNGVRITREDSELMGEDFLERIYGRVVLERITDGRSKKAILEPKQHVTEEVTAKLKKLKGFDQVRVRSVLTCRAVRGLCQLCYGFDLGHNRPVALGSAVGVIAAQSIGEPGTQLTMRTFHTGGVAGLDITQGLPRVEELFEVRPVRKPAIVTEVAGQVEVMDGEGSGRTLQRIVRVHFAEIETQRYDLTATNIAADAIRVKEGDRVEKGAILFEHNGKKTKARFNGTVRRSDQELKLVSDDDQYRDYTIPPGYTLTVKNEELVGPGDPLSEGSRDLHELYRLRGRESVQQYILREIQYIYSSQGQKLNDKHIEIILRQMFSRYYVKDGGETELLSGDIIERAQFLESNDRAKRTKKRPATGDLLLLGLTKSSLSTESFLSAASFQETARVLIDAAVSGKIDRLRGLKENVIIGKLIPAGTGFGVVKPKG